MKITFSKKETKNLGNYENVTVEITVEDKVDFNNETQEECYNRLENFVNQKLKNHLSNKEISIEDIKLKIVNLINTNEQNRNHIRNFLKSYNVNLVQELKQSQLKTFNEDLDKLYEK